MPENEFEKQVSGLMEEFYLTPSDAVWKKVEPQINKDKRRSRWLIIPLLLSILTLAGYFTYQALHQSNNNINKNVTAQKPEKDLSDKKNNQQKNTDTVTKDEIQATIIKENPFALTHRDERELSKILTGKKSIIYRNSFTEKRNQFSFPALINQRDIKFEDKQTSKLPLSLEAIKNGQVIALEKKEEEKIIQPLHDEHEISNDASTGKQFKENERKNSAGSISIVSIENKNSKTVNQKTRQWQWGITGFYGRSDVVENLLGIHFFQNYNAADYAGNPGQPPDSASIKTSNLIKASSAFKLGLFIQKPISKRSSISVGVNYTQLHTKTETGTPVDSGININVPGLLNNLRVVTYYKPGSGNFSTNTYRFIEIPVMFQHRFNNSTKFPLHYNAGISLTQLINADAVLYDRYNNIFYSENDLFRKTQLQVQFGINTAIRLKRNTSIFLGPQVQYSLSNLLQNKNYGNQHLFNWGLQVNILFHKK